MPVLGAWDRLRHRLAVMSYGSVVPVQGSDLPMIGKEGELW